MSDKGGRKPAMLQYQRTVIERAIREYFCKVLKSLEKAPNYDQQGKIINEYLNDLEKEFSVIRTWGNPGRSEPCGENEIYCPRCGGCVELKNCPHWDPIRE